MCSTAREKIDLKSPVINARYKRKVDRNVKVDAARTLMDIANSFELPEVEELESQSGTCTQTDVDLPLFEAMQAELQTLRTENVDLKEQVSLISEKYKVTDFEGKDEKNQVLHRPPHICPSVDIIYLSGAPFASEEDHGQVSAAHNGSNEAEVESSSTVVKF